MIRNSRIVKTNAIHVMPPNLTKPQKQVSHKVHQNCYFTKIQPICIPSFRAADYVSTSAISNLTFKDQVFWPSSSYYSCLISRVEITKKVKVLFYVTTGRSLIAAHSDIFVIELSQQAELNVRTYVSFFNPLRF